MRHSSSPYGLRLSLPLALLVLTFSVPSGAAKGGPKDTTMGSKSMSCPFVGNDKCPNDFGGGPRTATTTRTTAVPCQGAVRNLWSNPTTPTSWGKSGTGTVSGSTFTDSDAATATAVFADDMPGVAGAYTVSCTLRSGTLSVARVQIFPSGGGGGGICTHSLTSDAQRFACTQTITGTPTNVRALVYAGSATADTGTINLDQCQFERAPSAGDRCDSSVCYGSTSGIWQDVASNTACIAPGGVAGVESYGAVTNYWTNSTTPSAWVPFNGPTVSGNTVTDDSATSEGLSSVSAGTTTGSYTVACYLRSGTHTAARVRVLTDGAGSVAPICTVTGLTTTATRTTCSATVAGTPTFVRGDVLVGTAQEETGSINVDQCQLVKDSTPGRRCDSGGTATTCGADQHTVSTTGWPVASGEVEIEYVPASLGTSTGYLLDTRSAPNGTGVGIYVSAGTTPTAFTRNASGISLTSTSAVTLTAGAAYRVILRWDASGVRLNWNNTLSSSATATYLPTGHATDAGVGWGKAIGGFQATGSVRILYIGEPR